MSGFSAPIQPVAAPYRVTLYERSTGSFSEHSVDGELVLYDSDRQRVHVLNSSAAVIWKLCEEACSVDSLVDAAARLWPDADGNLQADVTEILRALETEGLLVRA